MTKRLLKRLLCIVIVVMHIICVAPFRAHAAIHTLSEFKKLYATFYILPYDMQYLKEKPDGFFLEGDIVTHFNNNKDNKYLFETFNRLQNHLKERGFVLVDSPQKADAILAFRIQLAEYDVYHQCARNASIRLIDPATHDTLMVLYTPGMSILTLKRDVYDELNALLKVIDANMDTPSTAQKFEKTLYKSKKAQYETIEKDGLEVTVANLYDSRLSRQCFGLSLKDFSVAPIRVILKNNTGQELVFNHLDSRLHTDTIGREGALSSYDTMMIVGSYDKLFASFVGSVLWGPSIGFGDTKAWAPENDKIEFALTYNKFDPITRIHPGEEVSGVLLFNLRPPPEKIVARTTAVPLGDATLIISAKKASGDAIRVQVKIN